MEGNDFVEEELGGGDQSFAPPISSPPKFTQTVVRKEVPQKSVKHLEPIEPSKRPKIQPKAVVGVQVDKTVPAYMRYEDGKPS